MIPLRGNCKEGKGQTETPGAETENRAEPDLPLWRFPTIHIRSTVSDLLRKCLTSMATTEKTQAWRKPASVVLEAGLHLRDRVCLSFVLHDKFLAERKPECWEGKDQFLCGKN